MQGLRVMIRIKIRVTATGITVIVRAAIGLLTLCDEW